MQRKLVGTLFVASVGLAALSLATVADARPFGRSGGGGGGGSVGHMSGGSAGHMSGGRGSAGNMGGNVARFSGNSGARFSGMRSGNAPRFAANNSYQMRSGNRNWSGNQWAGRHRHRGFGTGFGVGVAFGAPYGAYGYDDYAYDPYYADEGYETYAAVPGESADVSVQYCLQNFRSYDLATQTYLGFDGQRHSCP